MAKKSGGRPSNDRDDYLKRRTRAGKGAERKASKARYVRGRFRRPEGVEYRSERTAKPKWKKREDSIEKTRDAKQDSREPTREGIEQGGSRRTSFPSRGRDKRETTSSRSQKGGIEEETPLPGNKKERKREKKKKVGPNSLTS